MKRRLYFLLPNLDSARAIHEELLLARVEERRMHFLARPDLDLEDLPRANILQYSDLVHGLQIGLIYGGLTGIFIGILSVPLLGLSLQSSGILILTIAVAGALLGGWASSMIAISMPNQRLEQFENALEQGQILLMVDAPRRRVEELGDRIRRQHPEVSTRGTEPTIPAFP